MTIHEPRERRNRRGVTNRPRGSNYDAMFDYDDLLDKLFLLLCQLKMRTRFPQKFLFP